MEKRITPSLVISVIALVVALGGVSYAAINIPKNSVGSKQLKKNSVTTKKLKKKAVNRSRLRSDAVNSAKVKDGTLLRNDFEPGQLAGEAWYAAREPVVPLLTLNGAFQTVVETPELPAGSYVLNARANVFADGIDGTVICSMANDAAQNFTVDVGDGVALSMSATAVLDEPRTIPLNCSVNAGTAQIAQAHVIATSVINVNGDAFDGG